MAEYKNGGFDSKALAEKKSKRLEEALSAFTAEQTKQTVSKLLEEYVDESGKNYFGAGTRDTTLYFADDEYIKEMEKEKAKDNKPEKTSVVEKLHKLTSIIPKSDNTDEEEEENSDNDISEESGNSDFLFENEEKDIPNLLTPNSKTEEVNSHDLNEEIDIKSDISDTLKEENTTDISAPKTNNEPEIKEDDLPESEPTIIITPVKNIEEQAATEEETKEMRREFFDNEIEVDEVPRRRRKQAEPETVAFEDKKIPEINMDDIDDEDYEEDFDEEEENNKKNKFGNFFKRKKNDSPFDDEDYDDEDFDDDYDDEDDYYDDEDGFTFKRVLNIIIIIALVCSTAFFAASNYSNVKKLESANTQIKELNNGNSSGSEEEINQLKTRVDELTAENERLKGNSSPNNTEPTSVATNSTTITGTAPSEEGNAATGSGSTYTIKAGDTGSKICNAVYGQYTEELWQGILSANGMTSSSVYHPGDVLQIP